MARKKVILESDDDTYSPSPALSREARESQLINLAVGLAEKKMRDGTASSEIIVHFLKLATSKNQLETEILKKQSEYLDAKTEGIKAASKMEATYDQVIEALRSYGGLGGSSSDENIFRTE